MCTKCVPWRQYAWHCRSPNIASRLFRMSPHFLDRYFASYSTLPFTLLPAPPLYFSIYFYVFLLPNYQLSFIPLPPLSLSAHLAVSSNPITPLSVVNKSSPWMKTRWREKMRDDWNNTAEGGERNKNFGRKGKLRGERIRKTTGRRIKKESRGRIWRNKKSPESSTNKDGRKE